MSEETMSTQEVVETPKVSEGRIYEIGYHLIPTVGDNGALEHAGAIKEIITNQNGSIISEGEAERVELAYDMDKTIDRKNNTFSEAYFGWIKFSVAPEAVDTIASTVDAKNEVLRSILVKTVAEDTMSPKVPVLRDETPKLRAPKEEANPVNPMGDADAEKKDEKVVEAELSEKLDEIA